MKPGEKVAILIGVIVIALLAAYKILHWESRKYLKWRECAGDVQRLCAPSKGQDASSTLTIKCLVANYSGLSSSCRQQVNTKYKALLARQPATGHVAAERPGAEKPAASPEVFDLDKFLAPCRPYWAGECKALSDTTGKNVECFASQPNLAKFSDRCIDVMVEIVQWAPKECVQSAAVEKCKAVFNKQRLECILSNRSLLPASCASWTQTVGKILREAKR